MSIIGLGFWVSVGLAVLEVFGFISIGWWWVATPLLIGLGLSLAIWVIALVIALIVAAVANM